jgi:phosphoribosylanthranilate isomerase
MKETYPRNPNFSEFLQVAGVRDQAEADMLVECGVPYLGFPLRLPINKEDLSEADAAKIISSLPRHCKAILITYLKDHVQIIEFCKDLGVSIVQLHGDISVDELKALNDQRPELTVIKSLVIGETRSNRLINYATHVSPYVDAFITDTYDPVSGASGATGKTHDWSLSKRFVDLLDKPVVLAGGLNPWNVRQAIETVRPHGVDVHTGVEDHAGRKDRQLVSRFLTQAQKAFRDLVE